MSVSARPHRRQPTRLPRPWDSPGKNTGVGCHFLLQCMKVKSESEVAQWYLTLSDPMDCSLPASFVHGIFQARVLEWGAIAFSSRCCLLKNFVYAQNSTVAWGDSCSENVNTPKITLTVLCTNITQTKIQKERKILRMVDFFCLFLVCSCVLLFCFECNIVLEEGVCTFQSSIFKEIRYWGMLFASL